MIPLVSKNQLVHCLGDNFYLHCKVQEHRNQFFHYHNTWICNILSVESHLRTKQKKGFFFFSNIHSFIGIIYFGLSAVQQPQARSDNPLFVQPERDTFWFISINISKAFSGCETENLFSGYFTHKNLISIAWIKEKMGVLLFLFCFKLISTS